MPVPKLHNLTVLSREPVAKKEPSAAHVTLQMMRACALATFPAS